MSTGSVEPKETDKVRPRSHAIFDAFKRKMKNAPNYITRTKSKRDQPELLDERDWTKLLTHEQTTYREIKKLAKILKENNVSSFFYQYSSTLVHADEAIRILNLNRSLSINNEKALAKTANTEYKTNKQAALLEKYLKIHIITEDDNLHAPVVYESLRKPDQWDARKSSLVNNQENLTKEDQKDLLTFIRHIDNAIEAAKKTPDLKPAVDTNKAGTTITDPEQIIQAAYEYVRGHGDSAKNALKKLLGLLDDAEIKSDELVDRIFEDRDVPHQPLDVIQKNVIAKNRSGEKFSPAERETIIRFCDFATCIALPERELSEIQRQIDKSLALIQVETQDRPLIILHFARLLPTSNYQAASRPDSRRILDQIADRQLIPKNLQEIPIPPEGGAGKPATTSYQNQFIAGLAIQLGIPVFDPDSPQAIAAATGMIHAQLQGWIDPDIAIRIAVFVEENRDHDIRELKKLFPQIFFIKLPEVFTTPSYHPITTRRNTIMATIHPDRESH